MWSAMALIKALGGCEWEYEFLCLVLALASKKQLFLGLERMGG